MYQIVYASTELHRFSRDELAQLLQSSRIANAKRGVTGMLLYQHGHFLQVLEGEPGVVCSLYARIAADPRHVGAVVLHEGTSDHREFPDWSMGFRDLGAKADGDEISGLNSFLDSDISAKSFAVDPPRAKQLLLAFKDDGGRFLQDVVLPVLRAG